MCWQMKHTYTSLGRVWDAAYTEKQEDTQLQRSWEEKQMTLRDLGLIFSTNLVLSCKVCAEVVRSLAAAQTNASDSMLCKAESSSNLAWEKCPTACRYAGPSAWPFQVDKQLKLSLGIEQIIPAFYRAVVIVLEEFSACLLCKRGYGGNKGAGGHCQVTRW